MEALCLLSTLKALIEPFMIPLKNHQKPSEFTAFTKPLEVTDIQKMVVDTMQQGDKQRELFEWLEGCFLMVDEADHVLIEQAENQLYISSPCRGFQALVPLQFLALAYLTYDKDYAKEAPHLSKKNTFRQFSAVRLC